MAVFRIERTRDYTVMSNHHLRDPNLSLKSKGLLSIMLSLPDEWNYSTRGLASICKEGVDAIGTALKELEALGYISRRQLRSKDGRITDTEYTIYEQPQKQDTDTPHPEKPDMDAPDADFPETEKPAEININKTITQKSKKRSINDSFIHSVRQGGRPDGQNERDQRKEGGNQRADRL